MKLLLFFKINLNLKTRTIRIDLEGGVVDQLEEGQGFNLKRSKKKKERPKKLKNLRCFQKSTEGLGVR